MKNSVTPYNQEDSKKKQVTEMFDGISTEYDALNRKVSLGIDVKWRRRVVDLLIPKKPESILDIATGTGDLALALSATKASRIIGLDISAGMLSVGKDKVKAENLENTIEMVIGDSEALTYEENSFDAVTVAFGVRNFENLELGLSELFRVLKPGGTLVVLETAVPTSFLFKQGYKFHTQVIIPLMGKLFTRDQAAYKYLSDSAAVFPHGKQFNNILEKMGFIEVEDNPQTLGVASIYCATKP